MNKIERTPIKSVVGVIKELADRLIENKKSRDSLYLNDIDSSEPTFFSMICDSIRVEDSCVYSIYQDYYYRVKIEYDDHDYCPYEGAIVTCVETGTEYDFHLLVNQYELDGYINLPSVTRDNRINSISCNFETDDMITNTTISTKNMEELHINITEDRKIKSLNFDSENRTLIIKFEEE